MEPVIFRLVRLREVVRDILQEIFRPFGSGAKNLGSIEEPSYGIRVNGTRQLPGNYSARARVVTQRKMAVDKGE